MQKSTIMNVNDEYVPSEDEEYMNSRQLEYFKQKLLDWKESLINESRETIDHLKEDVSKEPDFVDEAAMGMNRAFELRTRDRYRKLIDKINSALQRIEDGEYGYCEVTGEKIGLKRLNARPIATLSIEAQERHEQYEKQHSEDD